MGPSNSDTQQHDGRATGEVHSRTSARPRWARPRWARLVVPAVLAGSTAVPALLASTASDATSGPPSYGSQTTLLPLGLSGPEGLALDSSGDLFVADDTNTRVVEWSSSGSESVLPIAALSGPTDVTVDGSGDVFVLDLGGNVIELPAGGAQRTVESGLSDAQAIVADASGDLFVAESQFSGSWKGTGPRVSTWRRHDAVDARLQRARRARWPRRRRRR